MCVFQCSGHCYVLLVNYHLLYLLLCTVLHSKAVLAVSYPPVL